MVLSWQLTPDGWLKDHNVWSGFFNPSFWPSLLFRTITSMTVAGLIACIVINTMRDLDRERRRELINRASHFLGPMILLLPLGVWYLMSIPADSREWVMGGSAAMTMFAAIAGGCTLIVGLYALIGLIGQKLYIDGLTATVLCFLAFVASGGGEFVREGTRKPYTVRMELFSNSITEREVAELRRTGSVTNDPYPMRDSGQYPNDQVRLGAKVYRFQCSVCHTVTGANSVVFLAQTWTTPQKQMNIAKLQHTKPFMPPFSGNAAELEGLVQWLSWEAAGRPMSWSETTQDRTAYLRIGSWINEAGTQSAQNLGLMRVDREGQ